MLSRTNDPNTNTKVVGFLTRNLMFVILAFIGIIAIPILIHNLWISVDSHEIMVVQAPFSGTLTVYTDPGTKWLGFGTYTKYPRRSQYSFSASKDQGKPIDQTIKTRFYDGGKARFSGVISWDMPLDPKRIVAIQKEFRNFEAIEQQLIRPMIEKVAFIVGSTMSSTESSAARRPEIPPYIDDQLLNGPYLTRTKTVMQKDPLTGNDKEFVMNEIINDNNGHPLRSAKSQITEYGVVLYPVTIDDIIYDPIVEDQIKKRQEATTQIQIAQANAQRAQQDAITTASQGEANAAKAKWEQETINAKEIAEAQKDKQIAELLAQRDKDVATLAAQTASQYKQQQILIGEGDSERKKLLINADGALQAKLEAYVKVQEAYAEAVGKYQGNWVPTTVLGGSGGPQVNGASSLVELLTAKTARDLSIDLNVRKQ